nr:hypothetical protein [Candidatus Nitrososphaera evergladensis]
MLAVLPLTASAVVFIVGETGPLNNLRHQGFNQIPNPFCILVEIWPEIMPGKNSLWYSTLKQVNKLRLDAIHAKIGGEYLATIAHVQ